MKYMTINNRKVAFDDEKNVLSVIRKAGINLPTFCYHSELSTYGACLLFRGAKRRHGDLYEYTKAAASSKDDFRADAFRTLQGVYNL